MLSKSDRKGIAELVNSIMCAELMQDSATKQGDAAKFSRWYRSGCEATVQLADRYGIELPCTSRARQWLAERQQQAATQ